MLYKAMQVKEIPIIFRGTIEGATSEISVEPIITSDPQYIFEESLNCYMTSFDSEEVDLTEKDKLYVQLGLEIYELNTKTFEYYGIPIYYWGETITDFETPPTFSEYPFAIIKQPGMINAYIIDAQSELTPFIIWLEDPRSGDLTPTKKIFSAELTGNGQIKRFHARFACGENGTLHINPYVILNGNITVNLCDFAKEGENYISGDNEDFTFECYVPIETHAMLYVEAENVGEYDSMLDVAIVVQYEDFIEEETIIGYEGINLRRNHR